MLDSPLGSGFVEVQRRLATNFDSTINDIVTMIQPKPADQPIVWFPEWTASLWTVNVNVLFQQRLMNHIIIREEATKLYLFVRHAHLLAIKPSCVPNQPRCLAILPNSSCQKLGTFTDHFVPLTVIVKLGRYVVGQVMSLVLPNFVKVRL